MTAETRSKIFKMLMSEGRKTEAYAIYHGNPPEELIEKPKVETKMEKKKK